MRMGRGDGGQTASQVDTPQPQISIPRMPRLRRARCGFIPLEPAGDDAVFFSTAGRHFRSSVPPEKTMTRGQRHQTAPIGRLELVNRAIPRQSRNSR